MGYKVEIETNNRRVKKCIEYADKENIPYIIVVGSDEVNTNKFKIRNMNTKEEYIIDLDNIDSVKEYIK
jgi:histidyl-tRNA synthetase